MIHVFQSRFSFNTLDSYVILLDSSVKGSTIWSTLLYPFLYLAFFARYAILLLDIYAVPVSVIPCLRALYSIVLCFSV